MEAPQSVNSAKVKPTNTELQKLIGETTDYITKEQSTEVQQLLEEYADLFAVSNSDLGRTDLVRYIIATGDAHPIKQPPRCVPAHMQEEVDNMLEEMIEKNVIEPSTSPWSSGIVLVKQRDGTTRVYVDYRRLNSVTVQDAYPLPRIDDSLDRLSGNTWFSTLALCSGYWQVEVEPGDRSKTAFASRKDLFKFRLMPFGLCSAPATFQRLMEKVMFGVQWQICLVYLDDVIVAGKAFEDMIKNLQVVFDRLKMAGLKLKPKKCTLFAKSVRFLGHVISEEGVDSDNDKVKVVEEWPIPANVSELRSFLGLCGCYGRYIRNFSAIAFTL